ncbi:hypothetical protein BGZ73_002674 [Actinomortierella ambigua]|nr:hypothetical protein BGZ73_002674 [Actinomortierella ambigua]
MNGDVYNKISERMKQENFTEDEIRTVQKAKNQLSNYTTGGSVLGAIGGIMLARSKKFKGLQAAALATGAFLIGSQVGMLFGAMASLRTIQSIPNFQRRFPVQQRSELMPDDAAKESQFQGFSNGDGYHGGNDPNHGKVALNDDSSWANVEHRARELQQGANSWSKIRQENMPKSAWTQIRQGNGSKSDTEGTPANGDQTSPSHQSGVAKRGGSSWDRIRQQHADGTFVSNSSPDGATVFPRTREDLESNPNRNRNKYGDTL